MKYVLVLLLTIAQLFVFAQIESKKVKEGKKDQKKYRISFRFDSINLEEQKIMG
jgi:hypothetical protein